MFSGQAGDRPQAPALLASDLPLGQQVLADQGYEADCVWVLLTQAGAEAVISSKQNRKQAIDCDLEIQKHRNQTERCIYRFKVHAVWPHALGK